MIYEFRSRATGTIVMTDKVAERMLGIIGKPAGPIGIITVAQLPQAVAALRGAIADERRARETARDAHATEPHHTDRSENASPADMITLEQRALPLIEMFERAAQAKRDVTWGA